jgi:hypothetical protein
MELEIHKVIREGLAVGDPQYKVLYKYQSFRPYTVDSLKKNHIKYSTHLQLNDAFDLAVRFREPFGVTFGEKWRLKDLVRPLAGQGYQVPSDPEEVAHYIARHPNLKPLESLALIASQFHIASLSDALKCIVPSDDWCGKVLLESMIIAKAVAENTRIFCLTTNPQSHLMWGYYGDGLRGLCIGYGCPVGTNPRLLEPVRYSGRIKPFDAVAAALDPWQSAIDVLCTKPAAWKHECEWRAQEAAFSTSDKGISISPFPVVSLIFGYRMPIEQRTQLTELFFGSPVPVFEAVPVIVRGCHKIELRDPLGTTNRSTLP